jgi:hypothetical protein
VHVYYAALADRVHLKADALGVLLRVGLPREWYYRLRFTRRPTHRGCEAATTDSAAESLSTSQNASYECQFNIQGQEAYLRGTRMTLACGRLHHHEHIMDVTVSLVLIREVEVGTHSYRCQQGRMRAYAIAHRRKLSRLIRVLELRCKMEAKYMSTVPGSDKYPYQPECFHIRIDPHAFRREMAKRLSHVRQRDGSVGAKLADCSCPWGQVGLGLHGRLRREHHLWQDICLACISRVALRRGKPTSCMECQRTKPFPEWPYL